MQESLQVKVNEIKELELAVKDLNTELMKSKLRLADEMEKTENLED